MVAAHRALLVGDARVVLPGGRDELREGLGHVDLGADEELEGVVEQGRVRPRPVERRRERGVEPARMLARLHPGDVALDRVDLAVVRDQAERLRPFPARRGVRREALVEDRPGDGPLGVAEVGVEARELRGGGERLVGDRPERERGEVDALDELRAPARPVGAELRVGLVRRGEHQLGDARDARPRARAQRRDVVRDVAPAERLEPLRTAGVLDDPAQPRLAQEAHRDPGALDARERRVEREQDAGAVAAHPVGGPGAAVRDRREAREGAVEELARGPPARVRDEADATGIALPGRIVQRGRAHGGCSSLSSGSSRGASGEASRRMCG